MKKLFDIDLSKSFVTDWGYTDELAPISYDHYEDWVSRGHAGDLKYLTDHRKEIRKNLKELWPKSESAMVFLFSYFDTKLSVENFLQTNPTWNGKKISGYVFGFEGEMSTPESRVKVFVIPTDEELVIARDVEAAKAK